MTVGVGSGVALFAVLLFVARRVSRVFRRTATALEKVAAGDLTPAAADGKKLWRDEASTCDDALASILGTLGRFEGGIHDKVGAAAAGDLGRRIDTSSFGGRMVGWARA